jgi:hypothetical protein
MSVESEIEVARDLARIHDERIENYKEVLRNSKDLETDVRSIFERMIRQSITFEKQLPQEGDAHNENRGRVYSAWTGIKVKHDGRDKKSILAGCADDELGLLNVYALALSFTRPGTDIYAVLASHEKGIKELYTHIKEFHDAQ